MMVLLACAVLGASAPRPAERPWPWPSLFELQPEQGVQSRAEQVQWLVDPDRSRRAEAQIRLLPQAQLLLPQLEILLTEKQDAATRERVAEALEVLTWRRLSTIPPLFPQLRALVKEKESEGRRAVAKLQDASTPNEVVQVISPGPLCGNDVGIHFPPPLAIDGDALSAARDLLAPLGGLARPALEQLLRARSPTARLYGLVLSSNLGLPAPEALVASLQTDNVRLQVRTTLSKSEFTMQPIPRVGRQVTVALADYAKALSPNTHPLWLSPSVSDATSSQRENLLLEWVFASGGFAHLKPPRAEEDAFATPLEAQLALQGDNSARARLFGEVDPRSARSSVVLDLANALRSTGAGQALDAQTYWNHARPLFRRWIQEVWRISGTYARGRWLNLQTSRAGFQHVFSATLDRRAVLRFQEPKGAHVQLIDREGTLVGDGTIPFTWTPASVNGYVRVRVQEEGQDWAELPPQFGAAFQSTVWLHPALFAKSAD
jgi:hypothetical protein